MSWPDLLGIPSARTDQRHHRLEPAADTREETTDGPGSVTKEAAGASEDLVAGHALDALADQIGVAVMARVLLDRVQVDPPDIAVGAAPPKRHHIIEALPGHRRARRGDLAPVGTQVSPGVGGPDAVEIGTRVSLGPVQVRHILTGSALAEPPALGI